VKIDAEMQLGQCTKPHTTNSLTGFSQTDFQDMPPRRLSSKIMIKADYAVHIGPRLVQFFGDNRNCLWRHVPELVLYAVKNRQQGARFVLQSVYNVANFFDLDGFFRMQIQEISRVLTSACG
jgi:hypothetical protein